MRSTRVLVLVFDQDRRFRSGGYLLCAILNEWRSLGIDVEVSSDFDRIATADLVIPHFDVTTTPPEHRAALARHRRVVNRRLVTIAKSIQSQILVRKDDDYAGPVIVKTDRNHGGLPEAWLQASRASIAGRTLRRLRRAVNWLRREPIAWNAVETIRSDRYPVFPSLAAVPPAVFGNGNLVVEKFTPEIVDRDYCIRYHYCLGERAIDIRLRSKSKVVKASVAHTCEELPSAPDEIHAIRHRLGFDYGKLDYVVHEGNVVLLDVNRTPALSALERFGLRRRAVKHLAADTRVVHRRRH